MALCCSCGGNRSAHTETDAQTRCKPKTQPHPTADVWYAENCHSHIKSPDNSKLNRVGICLRKSPQPASNQTQMQTPK